MSERAVHSSLHDSAVAEALDGNPSAWRALWDPSIVPEVTVQCSFHSQDTLVVNGYRTSGNTETRIVRVTNKGASDSCEFYVTDCSRIVIPPKTPLYTTEQVSQLLLLSNSDWLVNTVTGLAWCNGWKLNVPRREDTTGLMDFVHIVCGMLHNVESTGAKDDCSFQKALETCPITPKCTITQLRALSKASSK